MFDLTREILDDSTHKYTIGSDGELLAYSDVLDLWRDDRAFRDEFTALLESSPFTAYRWETPPISTATVHRPFEFVLLDSPGLVGRPDTLTFSEHFPDADDDGIVVFESLGGDAVLVVPSPMRRDATYEHLAAFVRSAPGPQKHALWRRVGQAVRDAMGHRPLWVSTAGGGVAWLHVRLDSRPKYYGHGPYRESG